MKKIAIELLLGFTTLPALAGGEIISQCKIEVDGTIYLDEPCEFDKGKGVSFTIGVSDTARSKYFAYVGERDGVVVGYWNGPTAESHADYPLGALSRDGACWINDNAKVCAWK